MDRSRLHPAMARNHSQQHHIQTLFLQPAESYDLREVSRLTNTPVRKLRREVAHGDRDASKVHGKWSFTWRQAAYVAMATWTLVEIHDALGADAAAVLPPSLTLRSVTVRLPEHIVRALETIAAEDETTLEDTLHGELIDLAGSLSDRMEAKVPGFRLAYLFPGQPSPTPRNP